MQYSSVKTKIVPETPSRLLPPELGAGGQNARLTEPYIRGLINLKIDM
jgi:hypothetical protein